VVRPWIQARGREVDRPHPPSPRSCGGCPEIVRSLSRRAASVGAPSLGIVLHHLTEPLRHPKLGDRRGEDRGHVRACKRVRCGRTLAGRGCYAPSFVLVRGRTGSVDGAAPVEESHHPLRRQLSRSRGRPCSRRLVLLVGRDVWRLGVCARIFGL